MESLIESLQPLYRGLVTLSTVLTMIFAVIAIYSWIQVSEFRSREEKELKERFRERSRGSVSKTEDPIGFEWKRIEEYMRSENPSDWKIAIMEADNMLEEVLIRMGVEGETLGDRLKGISSRQFPYLDMAWEAHKFRNSIAHSLNRPISRSDAERTIHLFYQVFRGMRVIA